MLAPNITTEILFNYKLVHHFADEIDPINVEQVKPPQQTKKPPMFQNVERVLNGNSHAHKHGIINTTKNVKGQSEYGEKKILERVLVLKVVAHLQAREAASVIRSKRRRAAYLGPIQEQIRAIRHNCDNDKTDSHEANVIRCPNEKDGYDVMRDHLNKIFLPRFN